MPVGEALGKGGKDLQAPKRLLIMLALGTYMADAWRGCLLASRGCGEYGLEPDVHKVL